MRTLLAYRDFESYTGGHGKFLDYLAHVQAHPAWEVALYLSPRSRALAGNPFLHAAPLWDEWRPQRADALLVGGTDWRQLDLAPLPPDLPVLNLVQGVIHADPGSTLRGFLSRRALRVCVSHAVAAVIGATGEVNGPVEVIPAAVDVAALAELGAAAPLREVFIDAVKQPDPGRAVAARLAVAGASVDLLEGRVPRTEYLARMAQAATVVTLPNPGEGFYLPGTEAMAMGRALVQYDCVGSREYLEPGVNALVPARTPEAIAAAAMTLRGDAGSRRRLVAAARATAARFDLPAERRSVHALLDRLARTWRG